MPTTATTETTAAARSRPMVAPIRGIVVAIIAVLAASSMIASASAFSPPSSPPSSSVGPRTRRTASSPAEEGDHRSHRPPRRPTAPLAAATAPPPPSAAAFSIPSIFSPADSRPVVLFDGTCNLCNAGVQLVLDNDRASSDARGNLRVAAMQSRVGRILLARLPPRQREAVLGLGGGGGGDGERYRSIVVAGPDRAWINSDACLRIGREMRGPLRYLSLLAGFVPRTVRDAAYKLVSRYRGKLFGRSAECRLWDDNWDTRFVDDANFGGRGENRNDDDPFADPSLAKAASSPSSSVECEDDDDDGDGGGAAALPPGTPPVRTGDVVRVVSSRPILHTHVDGHEDAGICSVGLVGTVTRVLEGRAYPKNVAVRFELPTIGGGVEEANPPSVSSFEAHFFPGQLRKE